LPDAVTVEYVAALVQASNKILQIPEVFLTLADDLLAADPKAAKLFFAADGSISLKHFMRHMDDGERAYVRDRATLVCARLFAASAKLPGPDSSFIEFLTYIADSLLRKQGAALKACTVILQNKFLRPSFISHPRAPTTLVSLLTNKSSPMGETQQVLYETTFCLWTLSFHPEAYSIFGTTEAVKGLVKVSLTAKDKVVRVGLATLRMLLGKTTEGDVDFNEQMIDNDILDVLTEIAVRQWSNPGRDQEDAEEDLKVLTGELQKNIRLLSSFDRYKVEVQSGKLKRGHMHSEQFWNENCTKFEYKGFALIKALIALLSSNSADPTTLAMACYDLGEFARFYEAGKAVIKANHGKERMMALVEHDDDEVKKEALQASAKLLISNWEYVTGS